MALLSRTTDVVLSGIDRGWHFGLQLYVSRHGEVVADAGYGEARPGVPMTSDTILPWLSAGKPLAAVAVMQLVERGLLTLEMAIAEVIPEFAAGGKSAVTLRHLLTHTGGFRNVSIDWPASSWDETLAEICRTPLEADWVLGETAGYHVASSWYVLGELIQRLDGRSFSRFLREEICEPLGLLDSWNGMPPAVWSRYGERIGCMWEKDRGEIRDLQWHDARHCEACSPGGNTRGPIHELGRFYECLLAGGVIGQRRLLKAETVQEMTRRQRIDRHDLTFQHRIDFGLGLILDSKHHGPTTVPYGYGAECSASSFGHSGSQSSIGFADPARQLVVAYVASCRPGEGTHQRRHRELMAAIDQDLGEGRG